MFKKRNLRSAYHITQANGDLSKITSMAMLAKGKPNTNIFSDKKVKDWFDYNLEMISYAIISVQNNHGIFDNNTGFEVIYFSLCTNNNLQAYLDEMDPKNSKIKNELLKVFSTFFEKPSLKCVPQDIFDQLRTLI